MVDQPQTHYAKGPGGNIAYQVVGDGPVDLVFLLLAPEEANTMQLKALARIARLLRDPEVCARLRRETDPLAVYDLLIGRATGAAA